jgi:hypothetical protein
MMNKIILILAILLATATSAFAYEATIEANWAWSGNGQTVQGFKFYLDGNVVQDVTNPELRISSWTMDLENGSHLFSMTAYGVDWESVHSPDYRFEYLYVPKDEGQAPTMYIRIN